MNCVQEGLPRGATPDVHGLHRHRVGPPLMHGFGGMICILLFVLGWLLWRVHREDRWLGIVSMSCPTTSATLTSWALS